MFDLAPRLKEKLSCPEFRHALPVLLNAVRNVLSQSHWMYCSMLHHSYTTWSYYENYLAIRMKCCRICGEKPSTLGIMTTRTGPLSTLKVGLFFNFFRGDILELSGPLGFICSLYQADKVRKLHWLFFTLSFTTSSKSS
jgi:hypothetical protein